MIDTGPISNPRQLAAASRAIVTQLDDSPQFWQTRRYLRRALPHGHRSYFDVAISHLVSAGMVEQNGHGYRLAPASTYPYLEALVTDHE